MREILILTKGKADFLKNDPEYRLAECADDAVRFERILYRDSLELFCGSTPASESDEKDLRGASVTGDVKRKQKPRVFISYIRSDRRFVVYLGKFLRENGIDVWIDSEQVNTGESLIEILADATQEADFVVAVLSSASLQSNWVKKELVLAITDEIKDNRVKVLPVKMDQSILSPFLRDRVYADFSKKHLRLENKGRLLRTILQLFSERVSTTLAEQE